MELIGRKENHSGLIVFSDFDGTIARRDVGNRLFHYLSDGKSEEIVARWRAGEIDSRECLRLEAEMARDTTLEEFFEFVDGFALDSAFVELVNLCRTHDVPLYIVSDGLDLYIHRLLSRHGLDGLPVFSNRARIDDGRIAITWPYADGSCGRCGNCKGYHVRRLTGPNQTALYVGDGKSDVCAVPEADVIFAKGDLAEHCRKEKIDFFAFDDFSTVTETIRMRLIIEPQNRARGEMP
jgi:2-hydroxy-3-keto-5-methylthiopentenyl-1-phosphate phosphatase